MSDFFVIDYARRLERIEELKAKERMSLGGQGKENFPNLQTRDIVAEKLDIGSGNLSPIQRITVTEKYRPYYEEKAKEKQGIRNDLNFPPKSAESNTNKKERNHNNETREKLSKLAGVGHDTYDKGRTILKSDNEEVKQKVLSGDMSINAGYNEM